MRVASLLLAFLAGCATPSAIRVDVLSPEGDVVASGFFDGNYFAATGEINLRASVQDKATGQDLVVPQVLEPGRTVFARLKPRTGRSQGKEQPLPREWSALFPVGAAAELGITFED